MAMTIFVCDRGWVVIGEPDPVREHPPQSVLLHRAAVVRRWGTSSGLGQLAAEGPLEETILDPAPEGIIVPFSAMVGPWFPCSKEAWQNYLLPREASTAAPLGVPAANDAESG